MPEKIAAGRSERRLAAGVHAGVGERLPDRPVHERVVRVLGGRVVR